MPFKTIEINGKKYIETMEDDKAAFVTADGTETAFDADAATARIAALNAESAGRRVELNDAKKKLEAFKDIPDPSKAIEAMKTVENLGAGELKTAAQVAEIREAAKKAAEQQVADAQRQAAEDLKKERERADTLELTLNKEMVGGVFDRSTFVKEKLSIPPDIAKNFFGGNMRVEDGKIVAYDANGSKIYSKKRPGEVATADEAIEILVDAYPNKASIIKGPGGGSGGGNGGGGDDKRYGGLSKAEYDKLSPVQRLNISRGVSPGTGSAGTPVAR